MRIEKINDNQIRCILTKQDLADRQIKLSELAFGSEKARGLFRDMIDKANDLFGFETDDMPLMIEAMPMAGENIVLQITKVENSEDMKDQVNKVWDQNPEENQEEELHLEAEDWTTEEFLSQPQIFEFPSLERVEQVARLLNGFYDGTNDLYKDESTNSYYLVIKKGYHTSEEFYSVCNFISEYAPHREYMSAKEAFLKEHGKLLVKENALQIIGEI